MAGIVDVTDYVDTYGLVNHWTNFSNLAFSTDPTIPVPHQGLGAAVRATFMAIDIKCKLSLNLNPFLTKIILYTN